MSDRRFNSFSAKEHLSYRPSDGLGVPPRPRRGALGNASRAPESHAASRLSERRPESNNLTPIRVPTTGAALNALVRPSTTARAREADRARGGCSGRSSPMPEPSFVPTKPLSRLAEGADCRIAALPPWGSLAPFPALFPAGFPPPRLHAGEGAQCSEFDHILKGLADLAGAIPSLRGLRFPAGFRVVGLPVRSASGWEKTSAAVMGMAVGSLPGCWTGGWRLGSPRSSQAWLRQEPFRPHRAGLRVCSPPCRQRVSRWARRGAA
jgi:hypothetical protein